MAEPYPATHQAANTLHSTEVGWALHHSATAQSRPKMENLGYLSPCFAEMTREDASAAYGAIPAWTVCGLRVRTGRGQWWVSNPDNRVRPVNVFSWLILLALASAKAKEVKQGFPPKEAKAHHADAKKHSAKDVEDSCVLLLHFHCCTVRWPSGLYLESLCPLCLSCVVLGITVLRISD